MEHDRSANCGQHMEELSALGCETAKNKCK